MTLTFCSARVLVVAARLVLLARRAYAVISAEHPSKAGITRNHSNRFPFERGAGFCGALSKRSWSIVKEVFSCSLIESSQIFCNQVFRFLLTAHHGENDWNEEEGRDCGEEQTANYRAAERCVLFAAFAEPEGHRHHADYHRQSGHHHRPQPCRTGLEGRAASILGLSQTFISKRDNQDAVGRCDADAHDRAHQRGYV